MFDISFITRSPKSVSHVGSKIANINTTFSKSFLSRENISKIASSRYGQIRLLAALSHIVLKSLNQISLKNHGVIKNCFTADTSGELLSKSKFILIALAVLSVILANSSVLSIFLSFNVWAIASLTWPSRPSITIVEIISPCLSLLFILFFGLKNKNFLLI